MSVVVLRKKVTESDWEGRLYTTTESLAYYPQFQGESLQVEFHAADKMKNIGHFWNFTLTKRGVGRYPKSVISGDWKALVHEKGVQIGDRVTILRHSNDNFPLEDQQQIWYEIIIERPVKLMGVALWAMV